MADEEALIRHTAISNLVQLDPNERIKLLTPLLYDPVKAVRIQTARDLTQVPPELLNTEEEKIFQANLRDYQKAMEYAADFSHARMNLGNMYVNLRRFDLAEKHYKAAFQIDKLFYPAKVNLAMLYNRMGKNDEAEKLFREVVETNPELHETSYSLGLLLVEQKKYYEAVQYLKNAAKGLPNRARIHYNLGLLLQQLREYAEAEASLLRALEIEPDSMDYLHAVADYYIKRSKFREAKAIVEQMISKHPSKIIGHDLLKYINRALKEND
ncbi:MAG: tetratricopeptide repeat protein [Candidatus Omnitrophota bacterium]